MDFMRRYSCHIIADTGGQLEVRTVHPRVEKWKWKWSVSSGDGAQQLSMLKSGGRGCSVSHSK